MDQAISFLGERFAAKFISFKPLSAVNSPLPHRAAFVVANSLRRSLKAGASRHHYNRRVLECRLAAMLLMCSGDGDGDVFVPQLGTVVRGLLIGCCCCCLSIEIDCCWL
jgi:galactokinase